MKLIEAEWLKRYVREHGIYCDTDADKEATCEMIDKFPTVDAELVRHGRWLNEFENEDGRWLRCSECRMRFWVGFGRDGNYCPKCGAKMLW